MGLAAWAERNGVSRVTAYCWFPAGLLPAAEQLPGDKGVTEVDSALTGHRREFVVPLGDRSVRRPVVGHRDRFCWFGTEYADAAEAADDEAA